MNLSNMFPASGGLAAQVKKPVATAVAKPTENKAVGSSLADCMQTRKRPGEWAIKWPKLRKQGFKDYRPLLTIQEVIDYCNRCEETGLGGFDYETSGDKDHRIPPTDEDGNTVTGKALYTSGIYGYPVRRLTYLVYTQNCKKVYFFTY